MEYLWLFLLFFAALAAGWFYLQRAKARSTNTTTTTEASASTETPATTETVNNATDEPPTA